MKAETVQEQISSRMSTEMARRYDDLILGVVWEFYKKNITDKREIILIAQKMESVRTVNSNYQTIILDGTPILEIYDWEMETIKEGVSTSLKANQKYRKLI